MQRVARAEWSVVALDAGPFWVWDPDPDWVSDEAVPHRLYSTESRVITGDDSVPLGSNNSGRRVGGSMVHYASLPSLGLRDCQPRRRRLRLAYQLP